MKTYGEFTLFTTMEEINEIKTIQPPTHDDVRLKNEGMTKGFSAAIYDRRQNGFRYITHKESEEELFKAIEIHKGLCINFPEVAGNWYTEIGDIFIYESHGYYKPSWGLRGIAVETSTL